MFSERLLLTGVRYWKIENRTLAIDDHLPEVNRKPGHHWPGLRLNAVLFTIEAGRTWKLDPTGSVLGHQLIIAFFRRTQAKKE